MSITPPQLEIPHEGETPRDRYVATAFSFFFHGVLLAFLLWVGIPEVSELLEGELGGGGGGDGGDQISLISLAGPPEQIAVEPVPVPPPPPEPEVVPDPTPTPVPPPPTDTVKTPPAPVPVGTPVAVGSSTGAAGSGAGSAGTGGGAGGGSGGGVGTGTGTGTGAGSGGGTGGGGTSPDGLIPPSPTALHLGPQAPNELRGRTVIVLLTIDANGKVTDARLEKSTGSSKYDAALRKSALGWRFRPARDREGNAVKGTFAVTYAI